MYAALRVDLHIVSMCEYNTGSTERCKCGSFFNDAATDSCRCVIACACSNRDTSRKSCLRSDLFCNAAGYFYRLINLCEPFFLDVEEFKDFIGPVTVLDVEELHTGCIRNVCCEFAGKSIAYIVFRQKDVGNLRVDLRLVISYPEDLGSSKACERRRCGNRHQLIKADLLCDLFALFRSSLIAPDDGLS